jgi:hypothetical protein
MSAHSLLQDLCDASGAYPVIDPGASGSIDLKGRSLSVVEIVTAAAESRTLPAPTSVGQVVTLTLKTDGGDCTLTVTGGFNEAGDTTLTLDDPGQFFTFISVRTQTSNTATPSYVWRVMSSHNVGNLVSTTDSVVSVTSSTLTVTEAEHNNKFIVLDLAAGIAVTLPAAKKGLRFRFFVKTTFTGAASIKSVSGADVMIGHALMGNDTDNTVVDWQSLAATTNDTIDLFGTANSTGGIAGQEIEIVGLATNLWFVSIRGDAAGSEATPFANTVA